MREACAVAAAVLHQLKKRVQPGVSTYDLDQAARELIAQLGVRGDAERREERRAEIVGGE